MKFWEMFILGFVILGTYESGRLNFYYGFVIAILILCIVIPFLNNLKNKKTNKK